ncbi:MAG: Verru_Chthon cassette protein A [Verrucomicrobiales bacterium]
MSPTTNAPLPAEARTFSTTLHARHRQQRGIAIITVLSVLLLMTVLILAFFKMAQSELTDAKFYSESVRTRQLSEIVTNVVIGQLREATQTARLGGAERYTWASQPGAITQFGSNFQGGTDFFDMAKRVYKLYSSKEMLVNARRGENLAEDVPGDWIERPAQYVDLNEPVYNSTQDRLYFPIVDPRGYATSAKGIQKGNIEGFSYSSSNSLNRQIEGVVEPGQGLEKQRLPMPVEWLYMLADGTLGAVDDKGGWIDPGGSASRPTEKNPMVARVAFWTDDESAKININTASEGAFWDIPRADSKAERDFGRHQPARNEVYRYPGHVSGISLSPILYPGSGGAQVGARPFLSRGQYEEILELSPKVQLFDNGSGIGEQMAALDAGSGATSVSYLPGEDRLYATVDELLYAQRSPNAGPNSEQRPLNKIFQNQSAREYLEYGRHSLTVNSNAPEINLFGRPRICLWPMNDVGSAVQSAIRMNNNQTYYDRLIAFAATVGPRRYFWQKNDASSRHQEIYNNARRENMALLTEYMFQLANTSIPGYGGTFERKYGKGPFKDSQEIMIQIWDYMRNTNLNDPLLPESYHYSKKRPFGSGGPPENRRNIGRGQIAGSCLCGGSQPHRSVWWQTLSPYGKGHGRVYTLSEVAMVFYCRAVNPGGGGGALGDMGDAIDGGKKLIEVGLLLETFSVTHGFTSITPNSSIQVAASSDGGNINGNRASFPKYQIRGADGVAQDFPQIQGSGTPVVTSRWDNAQNYVGKRGWGAHGGVRLFSGNIEPLSGVDLFNNPRVAQEGAQANVLAFATTFNRGGAQVTADPDNSIILDEVDPFMDFIGSPQPLALVLYDDGNDRGVGNLIQVFHVTFANPDDPSAPIRLPVPKLSDDRDKWTWASRIKTSGKDVRKLIDEEADVTRSVMVAHGDVRLISGRRVGNKHMWAPHPDFTSTKRHAHTLTAADGTKLPGFSSTRGYALDKNGAPVDMPMEFAPDFAGDLDDDRYFPKFTKEAKNYELSVDPGITGDWDNGIGAHIDGAYINRPDDGTSFAGPTQGSGVPYFDNLEEGDTVHRTFFAPNRVVSGAGQLGSIPTGIQAEIPWRTLLFRPDAEHFGARDYPRPGDPPDHVMLDFFWMPLVEPFPISQPFATMGKVNMNYRMVPFDYINRATAMHAVMKDQRMLAIDNKAASSYKKQGGTGSYRYPIDIPTTLLQFEDRFEKGEMFRSATEICEIYMIPRASGAPTDRNTLGSPRRATKGAKGLDYPAMRNFWKSYALTGDNSKERTYANLYSRLTTKSNVFQTHMIVEAIQKVRSSAHDTFDPERDKVTGRWRGSAVIERNIDPGKIRDVNGGVPDYFTDVRFSRHPSMEEFYNYRVLNVKQFNP